MITVLLVDDHPVVRDGLRGMLADEPGIEVVGEAGNGRDAVTAARRLRPDVVLMDLRMPGLDGVAATLAVRDELPGTRVLVLTTFDTDRDIKRALAAGAVGYLLKDTPRNDLVRGVRAAAIGEAALAPTVAARLMAHSAAPPTEPLTAREQQVLTLVADGLTNRQIGRRLNISETTVKTHLVRTFTKLGVDDRTAAVTTALQRGLLDLST
ncbi:response regulator transcription factor [Plantactinospora soyae]|uniref:DNA-binding NarL/FixJ family response regulator n=1 Tax=Plantactinospora soyae TaxID=1544732 RepID=A0A927R6A1_9ACTN|nr:response regulator transcription factor [Plantactinospora soyae]MBE1488234.1 DNA-binding NarL/FixJ family response regulator [Plantactinospora soyae]